MLKRLLLLSIFLAGTSFAADLSDTVKTRGELACGVSNLSPGAAISTEDGGLVGFYTDFCRALAVALFGDKTAVVYYPLSPTQQFLALGAGEVDILVGSLELNGERDAQFAFGPVIFHEGRQHYAPVLRAGDAVWTDTVSWLIYALIQAEEWGLTSKNVDAVAATVDQTALNRFLGLESDMVTQLGLEPDALRRTVRELGNYGEIYDRHLGPGATLALPRGANRLWNEGGLLYAPPFSPR